MYNRRLMPTVRVPTHAQGSKHANTRARATRWRSTRWPRTGTPAGADPAAEEMSRQPQIRQLGPSHCPEDSQVRSSSSLCIRSSAARCCCSKAATQERSTSRSARRAWSLVVCADFLWFLAVLEVLEKSGRSKGTFPAIFVKKAPEGSEL